MVDFLALNEKYAMIKEIFGFFKAKNKRWSKGQSFVIDKDFVEWAVIEACFPEANVLCQYHAITYWRKMLSRRSLNLKIAQREVLESMFAKMMKKYCTTTIVWVELWCQLLICDMVCVQFYRVHVSRALC